MQTKQEIHELVDRLPESETGAAARYLEFLLAHDAAAIDPGMLERIDEARARRGPAYDDCSRSRSGNRLDA